MTPLHTLLASAKSAEVGSSGGDNIVVELEDDTAHWAAAGRDVEEDVGHDCVVCGGVVVEEENSGGGGMEVKDLVEMRGKWGKRERHVKVRG